MTDEGLSIDAPDLDPETQGEALVELSGRLVYSLLKASVRVAAKFHMPLGRLVELLQIAYFDELRHDAPRDLKLVADRLGVSIRTAGSIHKRLKSSFFAPENEVAPLREVTGALLGGPRNLDELLAATELEASAIRRALELLEGHGWVTRSEGRYGMATAIRSFVADDALRRVDGLNNQMDVLSSSVWARFVNRERPAGARTWVFAATPASFEKFMEETVHRMRHDAVDLEEAALSEGDWERFGVTVAFAPVEETS